MKILLEIIEQEISDHIKKLKELVNYESNKTYLVWDKKHQKYVASLWDRISALKQTKKKLLFLIAEIQSLMELPKPYEREVEKTNREFEDYK